MRIVVTGATSFVGAGAVRELLKRGHHVYAVLRVDSAKRDRLTEDGRIPAGLTILEADLGNLSALSGMIEEHCDVFLHMGWRGAGSDSRRKEAVQAESVKDTISAVRAAKELGCGRFIFTGSQAEYGVHKTLITEDTPCSPASPYGKAKLQVLREAEPLCAALHMDYAHVRIFSTYGPGDHPWSLISSCIRAFEAGETMELSDCTQIWNFLYIEDAGRALADLAEYEGSLAEHGTVYNLAGPMEETAPLKEFVEQLYTMCGRKGQLRYGVRPSNAEGGVNLIPDTGRLKKVTGWSPETGFRQGIFKILRKL